MFLALSNIAELIFDKFKMCRSVTFSTPRDQPEGGGPYKDIGT
jgi:hypothetical protein